MIRRVSSTTNEETAAITLTLGIREIQMQSLLLAPCSRLRIVFCFPRLVQNCGFLTLPGCERRHPLLHLQAKQISMNEMRVHMLACGPYYYHS
jgi:hypothetical protein